MLKWQLKAGFMSPRGGIPKTQLLIKCREVEDGIPRLIEGAISWSAMSHGIRSQTQGFRTWVIHRVILNSNEGK